MTRISIRKSRRWVSKSTITKRPTKKLAHKISQLKRFKFAKRSEQLSPDQAILLDELIDTDIAAIEAELEALQLAPVSTEARQKPKRIALPPQFPRPLPSSAR